MVPISWEVDVTLVYSKGRESSSGMSQASPKIAAPVIGDQKFVLNSLIKLKRASRLRVKEFRKRRSRVVSFAPFPWTLGSRWLALDGSVAADNVLTFTNERLVRLKFSKDV
jgi:hypothetical protein